MRALYPIALRPQPTNGLYTVIIPGMDSVQGQSQEDAFELAKLHAEKALSEQEMKGISPSVPTLGEVQEQNPGAIVSLVLINTESYHKMYNSKSVRKSVTVPAYLDTMAANRNINVSQVLQQALRNELGL